MEKDKPALIDITKETPEVGEELEIVTDLIGDLIERINKSETNPSGEIIINPINPEKKSGV